MPCVHKGAVLELQVKTLTVLLRAAFAMLSGLKRSLQGQLADAQAASRALGLAARVYDLAEECGGGGEDGKPAGGTGDAPFHPLARMEQMRARQYATHDLVVIMGSYFGHRSLAISGFMPIKLGWRDFAVLRVLAREARTQPGVFLVMNDLLDAIEEEVAGLTNEDGTAFWSDPTAADVHKVVNRLRREILCAGGNAGLIESSRNHGGGLRLSTPPGNICIADPSGVEECNGDEQPPQGA